MKDALPFMLAIATIACQPVFDLAWKTRWQEVYKAKENLLEGGAAWIANVSTFLPTSVLTIYGAALLVDSADAQVRLALITGVIVSALASFALYIREALAGRPESRPFLRQWSHLHVWLVMLNLGGIAVAFTF